MKTATIISNLTELGIVLGKYNEQVRPVTYGGKPAYSTGLASDKSQVASKIQLGLKPEIVIEDY